MVPVAVESNEFFNIVRILAVNFPRLLEYMMSPQDNLEKFEVAEDEIVSVVIHLLKFIFLKFLEAHFPGILQVELEGALKDEEKVKLFKFLCKYLLNPFPKGLCFQEINDI